jgi:hypothetical protein
VNVMLIAHQRKTALERVAAGRAHHVTDQ